MYLIIFSHAFLELRTILVIRDFSVLCSVLFNLVHFAFFLFPLNITCNILVVRYYPAFDLYEFDIMWCGKRSGWGEV